jgi:hypothetical protein
MMATDMSSNYEPPTVWRLSARAWFQPNDAWRSRHHRVRIPQLAIRVLTNRMDAHIQSIVSAALLGLAATGSSACESMMSAAITPSESTTTLMQGWEHWFKLDWSTEPEPGGGTRIRGYITNEYGEAAEPLRLLGQALDESGGGVGQQIAWVPRA